MRKTGCELPSVLPESGLLCACEKAQLTGRACEEAAESNFHAPPALHFSVLMVCCPLYVCFSRRRSIRAAVRRCTLPPWAATSSASRRCSLRAWTRTPKTTRCAFPRSRRGTVPGANNLLSKRAFSLCTHSLLNAHLTSLSLAPPISLIRANSAHRCTLRLITATWTARRRCLTLAQISKLLSLTWLTTISSPISCSAS